MKGKVSKLIARYAATFTEFGSGSGRAMERVAKRKWQEASDKERRTIRNMMRRRVREHEAVQRQIKSTEMPR